MRKSNVFLAISLVVTLAFCFSVSLAKSENAGGANSSGNSSVTSQGVSAGSPAASPSVTSVNSNASASPSVSANASVSPVGSRVRGQVTAQEHRSVVVDFLQGLSQVIEGDKGIGEQVSLIAQEQIRGESTTTKAIEKIQTRNKVKTFFFGTDYKNTGALRSEMVQTRNRIEQLTRLMEQTQGEEAKLTLQAQIQTMQQEQERIENFIEEEENTFSLFGWFVKLFGK
ncbi:MAG: hypothetical protein PHW33_00300 [Candidatus Portnoybacteria bacterium]|jgi:hypothetical protein|nr:hypothetical protein [Candidatus Portnoybacteria bacterium]